MRHVTIAMFAIHFEWVNMNEKLIWHNRRLEGEREGGAQAQVCVSRDGPGGREGLQACQVN